MKTCSLILILSLFFAAHLSAQDVAVLANHSPTIKEKTLKTTKTVFIPNFERSASFHGELTELVEFLESNLVYPELGRENGIEGIVIIEFTVAIDGSIQEPKVVQGLGLGFDKEAIRLVNMMPKWKPAQQGIRAVNSKVRMPIAFSL